MRKIIGKLEWSDVLPEPMTYGQADQYVKQVGDGWRLPTPVELLSLWDFSTETCPEFPVDRYDDFPSYWSGALDSPWTSWYFDRGEIRRGDHNKERKVVLVREVVR